MGTGSPVLSCFLWADFAEKSKQLLTVRRKKFRLFLSDAAGSIGSMMPKNGIGSEQCAPEVSAISASRHWREFPRLPRARAPVPRPGVKGISRKPNEHR
jgi:hypothetical protein